MASTDVSVPDPMRRDQTQTDAHQTLVAALIKGENSGISKRSIPEVLAAVKAELARTTKS